MPKGEDTNKFKEWLEGIFSTINNDSNKEKSFGGSLLYDEGLKNLYLALSDPEKTHLATRIRKYKDSSFTLSITEATASAEATVSDNLIKAFIKVNNAKAELDQTAEGVEYTKKEDNTDSYKITLTKEKHTINIPDKKTGELYTAVFTKNASDVSYTMTIEITGVNGATKQGGDTDFQTMQNLVQAEKHEVTLMVGDKSIDLFNKGTTKTIEAINGKLSAEPKSPTPAALGTETSGDTPEAPDGAPAPVADTGVGEAGASESPLSWADWAKGGFLGAVTGATVGAGAGFIAAGTIAVIAVVATAPISLPTALSIAGAGALTGTFAGARAGLSSGIKTQNEAKADAGWYKITTKAIAPSAVAGAVAGLATGAGAIAGAAAAHGALGTVAASHATLASTTASTTVRIIGDTGIACYKGEASLSKFGIDATLATVGIVVGEAVFDLYPPLDLTESTDLALGGYATAITTEIYKYGCQEEKDKKPWALLLSMGFSVLGATYSVGAAEFGAADSLRHVGESPSQSHHDLQEDIKRISSDMFCGRFGEGDNSQIATYQKHVFKIFGLGECETGSVFNLAENQNKIDKFLHENPEAIKNLYHYLMPTETKNNVYGELEFISHHAEDIDNLNHFFASDTTNADGEKLSLLEQLKVVNALKQVDPDFTLETTTTFDDYFKEHKSIITQAMGFGHSNPPHPITSQDFCNLLKTGGEEEFQNSLNHLAKLQSETKQMFDLKTSDTSHSHHHSIHELTENQASLIKQLKTHEEILKNMAHDLDALNNNTNYLSSLDQAESSAEKVEILMDMTDGAHTKLDGFFTKDDLSGHSIADKLRFVAALSENSQDITRGTDFDTYYKNNTVLIEKTIHLLNPQAEINKTNFINTVLEHASDIDTEYVKLNTDTNVPFAQKVDFLTEYTKAQNKILNYFPSQNSEKSFDLNNIEDRNKAIHDFIKDDPKFQFVNSTPPHGPNDLYSKGSLDEIGAKFEAKMYEINKHIGSSATYCELPANDKSGYTLFAVKDQADIVTHIFVLDEKDNRVVLDINSTPENETDIVKSIPSVWCTQVLSSISILGITTQDSYYTSPATGNALNDDSRPNEYLVAKFLNDHFGISINANPNNVFHSGDTNPLLFGRLEDIYFKDKSFVPAMAPSAIIKDAQATTQIDIPKFRGS